MSTMPDVALRDADRWADEEGRRVAHEEHVDHLVDRMMDDVEEVEDLIRYSESGLLARALANLLVVLWQTARRELPAGVAAAYVVAGDVLQLFAREQVECRLRDGDVP